MAIDDQALKDALRAIEAGDIPEDLDLPDPELSLIHISEPTRPY